GSGASGDLRDLLDGELVEIAEHDHDAVELRKRADRRADPRAILARNRLDVGRGRWVGDGARVLDLDPATQLAAALAHIGDRLVRRDPQEPVPKRPRLVVAVERPVRLEEGRARDVERCLTVAGDTQRDTVDLVLVLADTLREGHGRSQPG